MRLINIIGSLVEAGYGSVIAKVGSYFGDKETCDIVSESTEIWQNYGFASRPKPADSNGCCEGIVDRQGGQERIIATRDLRSTKALGDLSEGDSALYADVDKDSVATVVCKADGLVYLNAPVEIVNGSTETAHVIFMDPAANVISIVHEAGHSIIMKDDMIQLKCGSSIFQVTESGITIAGKITMVGSIVMDPTSTIVCGAITAAGPIKGNPVVP